MDPSSYRVDVVPAPPLVGEQVVSYDDLLKNPELYYAGSDIVWMMISSALVLLMIPATCLLYSGHAGRSSALILFRLPLISTAVIGVQWYLWGYTITFTSPISVAGTESPSMAWYGSESTGNALRGVIGRPVGAPGPKIPELVYVLYQGMFASFTAALVSGGTIRKVKVGRYLIFVVLWSTLVYDTVARWTWHPAGWSRQRGVMDFAGGTAVHITSGTTVAAFAAFYECETKGYLKTWNTVLTNSFNYTIGIPYNYWIKSRKTNSGPNQEQDFENASAHGIEIEKQSTAPPGLPPNRSETELVGSDNGDAAPITFSEAAYPPTSKRSSRSDAISEQFSDADSEDLRSESRHNVNNVVLGTALLWIGWFGFNGGSALGGNLRAVSACLSTHISACAGGTASLLIAWGLNSLYRMTSDDDEDDLPLSVVTFSDGVIIGLVTITPAAGYVPVWSAAIFGLLGAIVGFFMKKLCKPFMVEDKLQIFAVHTGGGGLGMFLTALFADQQIVGLDGYSTIPDWSIAKRLRVQMLDAFMGLFYTFFMTFAILVALRVIRALIRRDWSSSFLTKDGRIKHVQDSLQACVNHTRTPGKNY